MRAALGGARGARGRDPGVPRWEAGSAGRATRAPSHTWPGVGALSLGTGPGAKEARRHRRASLPRSPAAPAQLRSLTLAGRGDRPCAPHLGGRPTRPDRRPRAGAQGQLRGTARKRLRCSPGPVPVPPCLGPAGPRPPCPPSPARCSPSRAGAPPAAGLRTPQYLLGGPGGVLGRLCLPALPELREGLSHEETAPSFGSRT